MNKLFTKLVKLFFFFWEKEIIRFLFAGGINTLIGGILIPIMIKQVTTNSDVFNNTFLPLILGYLIWFPFAYLIQVRVVFKTEFDIKRFFIYPTTQVPNYLINQGLLYLFEQTLHIHEFISLILAALFATPIMFVLVRLVVKKKK